MNKGPYILLAAQAVAHLSIIPMIMYAGIAEYVIAFVAYFFMSCVGMSATYHRLLADRTYKAPQWFERFGSVCGTLALTGSTISWCAIHRAHHHKTDTEADPHSPHYKPFYKVQWLSMFDRVSVRYAANLLRSPFHQMLHKHYWTINLAFAAFLAAIDPFAVVYAYLFPAMVTWNMGSFINTFGHTVGYRNYDSNDNSRNNLFLGYLLWGEGWHNNHHAEPVSHEFGRKWWEMDITAKVINLVKRS